MERQPYVCAGKQRRRNIRHIYLFKIRPHIYIYIYSALAKLVRLLNKYALPAVCNNAGVINAVIKDYVVDYGDGLASGSSINCWYRKWKSGRVQQGGYLPSLGANSSTNQPLLKEMANNTYFVSLTEGAQDASSGSKRDGINTALSNNTATTVYIASNNESWAMPYYWSVDGKGKI
jgi:hypothetical protein